MNLKLLLAIFATSDSNYHYQLAPDSLYQQISEVIVIILNNQYYSHVSRLGAEVSGWISHFAFTDINIFG